MSSNVIQYQQWFKSSTYIHTRYTKLSEEPRSSSSHWTVVHGHKADTRVTVDEMADSDGLSHVWRFVYKLRYIV